MSDVTFNYTTTEILKIMTNKLSKSEIYLDQNFFLYSDSNQWILECKKVKKRLLENVTQDIVVTTNSYHPNIMTALKKYIDLSVSGSNSINQVIDKLNEIESTIKLSLDRIDKNKK